MDPYKKIQTGDGQNQMMTGGQEYKSQNNTATLGSIPEVDRQSLKEDYQLLINYQINLFKIDELILLETEEQKISEYQGLKGELEQAIREQMDKIKSVSGDYLLFSTDILSNENKGRLCRAYYEKDDKWYHAIILEVDGDEQETNIQFIGYKEVIKLHTIFIKLIARPDPSLFKAGFQCQALYADDAHYYPCMIESVTEDGQYVVKYLKYKNKDTVPLDFLRESKQTQGENKLKRTFQNLEECQIPENLQILPNDSQQQRMAQKKKIKALQQSWKQAVIEQDGHQKQNNWKSFNMNAQEQKMGHFQDKRESIFKSPETIDGKVGVMNSGKGMTNIDMRTKMNLSDNSHLSRLF